MPASSHGIPSHYELFYSSCVSIFLPRDTMQQHHVLLHCRFYMFTCTRIIQPQNRYIHYNSFEDAVSTSFPPCKSRNSNHVQDLGKLEPRQWEIQYRWSTRAPMVRKHRWWASIVDIKKKAQSVWNWVKLQAGDHACSIYDILPREWRSKHVLVKWSHAKWMKHLRMSWHKDSIY